MSALATPWVSPRDFAPRAKAAIQNKVFVTETSDKKIAETVIKNAGFDGKCRIVSVDSMQSATQAQIKAGKNYIGVMKENYSKIFE